jgi:NAD(P)-dependent dehydrogenase (short-subunit alcohol dehydrogenase family)
MHPFEKVMQINYLGSVYCTYAALPHLKQKRGRIVVTCSLAGLINRLALKATQKGK